MLVLLTGVLPLAAVGQTQLYQSTAQPLNQAQAAYRDVLMGYNTHQTGYAVQVSAAASKDLDEQASIRVQAGQRVYEFPRQETRTGTAGHAMWFGRTAEGAELYLASRDGMVSGLLTDGSEQYWIDPLGDDLHWWSQHDANAFPNEEEADAYADLGPTGGQVIPESRLDPVTDGQMRSAAAGDCKIRVLVAYTNTVYLAHADVIARVEIAMWQFNKANDDSQVNWNVELAAVVRTYYNEPFGVTSDDILDWFENTSDGRMDEVHTLRALYDADYCQLVTEGAGCGLASGIGSSYSTAFCQSQWGCFAGNLTFPHEFGHLHGCQHDPYVLVLPIGSAFGFVSMPGQFRTVMAYGDQCADQGFPCPRVKHWSNPNTDSLGNPFGTPNTSNPFDNNSFNVEKLNDNGPTIAAYEARQTAKSIYAADVVSFGEYMNAEGASTQVKPTGISWSVSNGGSAEFRAADKVTLQEGFTASTGSYFRAHLDGCTSFPPARHTSDEANLEASLPAGMTLRLSPNPANTQTVLDVSCSAEGALGIRVVDLQSRERGAWIRDDVPPGPFRLVLPVAELPAGIYLIQLQRGAHSAEARLVVSH